MPSSAADLCLPASSAVQRQTARAKSERLQAGKKRIRERRRATKDAVSQTVTTAVAAGSMQHTR